MGVAGDIRQGLALDCPCPVRERACRAVQAIGTRPRGSQKKGRQSSWLATSITRPGVVAGAAACTSTTKGTVSVSSTRVKTARPSRCSPASRPARGTIWAGDATDMYLLGGRGAPAEEGGWWFSNMKLVMPPWGRPLRTRQ
ncbi:hypothetical protein GCM10027030_26810 [Luteococcus sediminum]